MALPEENLPQDFRVSYNIRPPQDKLPPNLSLGDAAILLVDSIILQFFVPQDHPSNLDPFIAAMNELSDQGYSQRGLAAESN